MQSIKNTDKAALQRAARLGRRLAGRQVILASASPRRKELMRAITSDFLTEPADIDESLPDYIPAKMASEYLARLKCLAVAKTHPHALVIGSDTTVVVDNEILGKPNDAKQAKNMLKRLSGRTHSVVSGIAVSCNGRLASSSDVTSVVFTELDEQLIDWYISTGSPFDKAGGYGIQDFKKDEVYIGSGSYTNVVGLPVEELTFLIDAFLDEEPEVR